MKNHDRAEKVFTPQKQRNVSHQAKLNILTEQFDTLLERMQSPKARRGMAAAFRADSKQLGKAAVAAARKRAMASQSKAVDNELDKSVVPAVRKRA